MTKQWTDTCMWGGQKWAIESWDGNRAAIPSNAQLGINTKSESSANWSGRIDHFVVHREKLYLLKIEVNLDPKVQFIQPERAMREVIVRYENRWADVEGTKRIVREHRFEYLVFHDLFIPYTGDLFLSYPVIDLWEQPYTEDAWEDGREEQRLVLRRGMLIN